MMHAQQGSAALPDTADGNSTAVQHHCDRVTLRVHAAAQSWSATRIDA